MPKTILTILVLLAGAAVSGCQARRSLALPDRIGEARIDIGGRSLHVSCAGTGTPTVILEAGLEVSLKTWAAVQPSVAKFTHVCAYDRAGLGSSDPDPATFTHARTSSAVVEDLHRLLLASPISGPYVLVGHSLGGAHIRLFASQFPQEVVGMVLVDASHENQPSRLASTGYTPPPDPPGEKSAEHADMLASLKEVAAAHWTTDIPLVVVSHGDPNFLAQAAPGITAEQATRMEAIWLELQRDLARHSSNGRLVVARHSGHFVQTDEPSIVIDAIRDVVDATRKHT